jgi:tetratricopeptide (TPR) repeat protein
MEIAPEAVQIIQLKTNLYMREGKPEQAKQFIAGQLEKYPENPALHELLGRVQMALNEDDEAEKSFIKASELEPKWLLPYYRIGALYLRKGEIDQGINKFEEALAKNPDSPRLAFTLGTLYQYTDNYEKARENYASIVEKHPEFTPALNNLAYLIADHSDDPEELEEARLLAEKAAKSGEPSTLDTLGWVHYKLGNLELALQHLDNAFRERPDSAELGYHLAVVLNAKGDKEGAKSVLEKVKDMERMSDDLKNDIQKLYDEVKTGA